MGYCCDLLIWLYQCVFAPKGEFFIPSWTFNFNVRFILKAAGYIKRPMCLESLKCRRTPRFLRQSLRSRADGSRWRGVGVHTNSNEDISSISTKINLQVGRLSGWLLQKHKICMLGVYWKLWGDKNMAAKKKPIIRSTQFVNTIDTSVERLNEALNKGKVAVAKRSKDSLQQLALIRR